MCALLALAFGAACRSEDAEPSDASPGAPQPFERPPPRRDDAPLFAAYPRLAEQLPRLAIGAFRTPVEEFVALSGRFGAERFFVKRDDLSAAAYGGGKVRKLEFLLGEARRLGRTKVVTCGSAGSNQAAAVAVHGRALGIDVLLLLAPERPSEHVRENLVRAQRAGAELRAVSSVISAETLARRMLRESGGSGLYFIEPGASSERGNVGFVNAGFELAAQVEAQALPAPHAIYVALGTMGSAVGLTIGLKAAGLKARVIGVRASSPETSSQARFLALYSRTVAYLRGIDPTFPALKLAEGDLVIDGRELGPGYARPTPEASEAVRWFREQSGIPLETTYTGKALAAAIRDAPKASGKTVLFWNTHASQVPPPVRPDARAFPDAFRVYFREPSLRRG